MDEIIEKVLISALVTCACVVTILVIMSLPIKHDPNKHDPKLVKVYDKDGSHLYTIEAPCDNSSKSVSNLVIKSVNNLAMKMMIMNQMAAEINSER